MESSNSPAMPRAAEERQAISLAAAIEPISLLHRRVRKNRNLPLPEGEGWVPGATGHGTPRPVRLGRTTAQVWRVRPTRGTHQIKVADVLRLLIETNDFD